MKALTTAGLTKLIQLIKSSFIKTTDTVTTNTVTLATVATSGSYNDLSNKPTIGNGTITFTQGGVSKGTITTNQTGNSTIALDAGGTVDQTFDGTSANAQSGVAIARELGNYVTGDNTRFDGQWVVSDTVIGQNLNLNGSTPLEFTLQVPEDGNKYDVLLSAVATSTSTSGQLCGLGLRSGLSNSFTAVCRCIPRSATAVYASGNIILPLSTDRKLYLERSSTTYGSVSIYLKYYRRIGSNT